MSDQATFDFPAADPAGCDRTGFQIGWDHAHHGLVPAPELLLDGTPVSQGWRAGRAVFGSRTLASPRPVRQWLQLRSRAWRRGIAFESTQVTAHYLAQLETVHCPVTRQPFGGTGDDAPRVVRLQPDAGYAAGNLALLSRRAAAVRGTADAREALRRAARIEAGIDAAAADLTPAESWRLAVLQSFVTPLPFALSVRVPLRVLPPNRVRLLNAPQGLQALLTLQFATPGWSARLRRIADLLPAAARHDFQLFVGALAPRLIEAGAGADAPAVRRALEDAWCDERLNRRWQQFAHVLGERGVEALLERVAASADLGGQRTLLHAPAQAVDGWSLATRGHVAAVSAAQRQAPSAPPAARRRTAARPAAPASRA